MDGASIGEGGTTDMRADAIVLGAGVSGLVSAAVLLDQGCRRVVLVDEYPSVGGNHLDWSSGGYTFDVGSLIFQDDSPLLRHFPEMLERYVPISPSWARLTPQAIVTSYPVSLKDDVLRAGPVEVLRILGSALLARLFQRKIGNAREFARFWIGARLLRRSGLDAYMTRFYGVESDQIDVELARKRMLWISENARLRSVLARLLPRASAAATNRQLARPREGFAHLYEAAVQRLEARGAVILLGQPLGRLVRSDDGLDLHCGSARITAARVVSTIPIRRAERLCGLPETRQLEAITLVTLYFSFAGERGFDCSVLYNFSFEGAWKRLTVYSDFYGRAEGREYFAVEAVTRPDVSTLDEAEADFRRHVVANRLFRGDLVREGGQSLENAYPIYRRGADEAARRAMARLRDFGVESFGRQGGFDYQPTARVSTLEAERRLGSPTGGT